MHVGLLHSIVPWPESQRPICREVGKVGSGTVRVKDVRVLVDCSDSRRWAL